MTQRKSNPGSGGNFAFQDNCVFNVIDFVQGVRLLLNLTLPGLRRLRSMKKWHVFPAWFLFPFPVHQPVSARLDH